ncbi:hypothetical protein LXA43DRAFT_1099985 [Ganoderma leucocontextum]|nr:hypothetical protein LXA43DRAFT_1099985 [Ganoderma leucocontextum]
MPLYQEPTILLAAACTYKDVLCRILVAQCSPDTFGLIVRAVIDGADDAMPPLASFVITEETKFEINDRESGIGIWEGEDPHVFRILDKFDFWSLVSAIADAKGLLVNRRARLRELLDHASTTA